LETSTVEVRRGLTSITVAVMADVKGWVMSGHDGEKPAIAVV
jgi:hypothetical protein